MGGERKGRGAGYADGAPSLASSSFASRRKAIKAEFDASRQKVREHAAEAVRLEKEMCDPSAHKGEGEAAPLAPVPADSCSDSGTDEDEPIAVTNARREKRRRREGRAEATAALIEAIETRDANELQVANANAHASATPAALPLALT